MENNEIATCICGADGDHAAHWDTATGHTLVGFSCSEACSDAIEKLRDRAGWLTLRAFNTARTLVGV